MATKHAKNRKRSDPDKDHRIRQIVTQWLNGPDPVSESALVEKHPDLLPELRHELKKAKMLQAAAEEASSLTPLSDAMSGRDDALKKEQDLLETSLTSYRIIKRIDCGGQGAVYQAVQKTTNRHVAIKVLLDGPLASEARLRRFEREVKLVSRLRHQNIVTLHDSGVVNGRPYFVMEYVDGVPIDDYILFHLPTVDDCVRLVVKVCRALACAHQRGIIHRDLKPANILVDMSGEPKILDFGLAKTLNDDFEASLSITTPGRVIGTLPFLSPEQVEEHEEEIDVRTDIYSLGVILYRLLTGVFPYTVDGGAAAAYRNIVHKDPASLRKVIGESAEDRCTKGDINDDLDHIVLKALAKEKERRYQSVLELADDLDRYLNGDAVEAKGDGGYYILKKTLRRYRFQFASLCAVLVVLLVASVVVTKMWLTASDQREQATAQREVARQVANIAQLSLDDFIGEVIESIGSLAGASVVQDKLLEIVQARYRQLMPLVESDETMDVIRTRIHERLGDMARKQGHHAEASEHYRAFLNVQNASDDSLHPDDGLAKLRVLRKLANVAEDRASEFENAVAFGERLLEQNTQSRQAKYELCKTRVVYAKFLFKTGRYESAVEQLEPTVGLAKQLSDQSKQGEKWTELLTDAYQWDGESRIMLGDGNHGVTSLKECLRLREALVNQSPANIQLRHKLRESYMRLGTTLCADGKFDDAQLLYERAFEIGKYLMSADPDVVQWKRELLMTLDRLIRMLFRRGNYDVAEECVQERLRICAELVATEPNNLLWQRAQASSLLYQGKLLYKQGQWEAAYDYFLLALITRDMIADKNNDGDLSLDSELASAYDWLGKCSAKLGNRDEALEHLLVAYDLRRRLVQQQPEAVRHTLDCVLSQVHLSSWYLELATQEHDRNAAIWVDEAKATLVSLHESGRLSTLQNRYESYKRAIKKNKRIICNRADKRAADTKADQQ